MRRLVLIFLLLAPAAQAEVGGYAAELKCLGYQTDGDSNTACQTSEPLNWDDTVLEFWQDDGSQNGGVVDPPDSETGNCSVNGGDPGCQKELGLGIHVPLNEYCADGWVDEPVGTSTHAGIMHLTQEAGTDAGLSSLTSVLRVLSPTRWGGFKENYGVSPQPNPEGLAIADQTLCMRYYVSFEEGFDMDNWSGTEISMKWLEVYNDGSPQSGPPAVEKGMFPKTSDRRFCEIATTSGAMRPNGGTTGIGWVFPGRTNFTDPDGACVGHEVGHVDAPPSTNMNGVLLHENCTQGTNDPDGGTGWCRFEYCIDHNLAIGDTSIADSDITANDSVRVRYRVVDIDTGEESLYATVGSTTTGTIAYTGRETLWNNFFQQEPRDGSSTEPPQNNAEAACCDSCTVQDQKDDWDAAGYQHLPADRFFSHLMVAYKSNGSGRGVGDWWIGAATEITEDIENEGGNQGITLDGVTLSQTAP